MSTGVGRAAARKQPPRLVTKFGPVAMLLAGRRWFPPWAQLRHRGRRSGKEYAIPVALLVTPTTFVIGLPWGPRTNWAQNVLAAQGCSIRWKGVEYNVTSPRLVDASVAVKAANGLQRVMIRRTPAPAFLEVTR